MAEARFSGMNTIQSSSIATQLRTQGFSILFERVCYDPKRPQWCAQAFRDGRQWRSFGEDLNTALVELGKLTIANDMDDREMATSNATSPNEWDMPEAFSRSWGINE